ncbi:MAG: transglutaminase-like domain-containing protein [Patescibacteria group bacterium]|nr:transglutaminase-like domain-containing protein [Patescibacteria group bacterium]
MIKKLLLFTAFVFLLILLLPTNAFASNNFSTDYNVSYDIKSNTITHVNLNITVTNLSDTYFTPTYEIEAGFKDIQNLNAYDEEGKLNPALTQKAGGTGIQITFNKRVVGLGNKHILNISFDTNEIAQNLGNIWEVNIPGISSKNDFASFNAVITYPNSLGKPSFIKPNILSSSQQSGNKLTFNKDQLGQSGISITFGSSQIYGFDLIYHLGNANLFPVKTEIALPPSTNYQDVIIDSMSPKPLNVRLDNDGNWLAQYYLASSQNLNIEVKGKAKINLNPTGEIITNEQIKEYLKSKPYWEADNAKIKDLAQQLKTPQEIYNYVVRNLTYDYSRVSANKPRLGAASVLSSPDSAVCLEFTDLFIALSRAAGIPAREVDGFAYTKNTTSRPLSLVKDILHAWPEYYDFDKKTWIMIDPTWGNTTGGVDYFNTLDFDHFAFVIKGEDSSYPVPAGGYKLSKDKGLRDVNVDIGDDFSPRVILKPTIEVQKEFLGGLPVNMVINVKNQGNSISETGNVFVSTNNLTPKEQTIYFPKIPPYGSAEIPVVFSKTPVLTNRRDTVKIAIGNNTYSQDIKILPIFFNRWVILGGVFFVAIVFLSIIIARSRRISFPKQ